MHKRVSRVRIGKQIVQRFFTIAIFWLLLVACQVEAQSFFNTSVSTIAGGYKGDGGPPTSAVIFHPYRIAIDSVANLVYIVDFRSQTVRVVNRTSNVISTFAGRDGEFGFSGDGEKATAALFHNPTGIAIDVQNNLVYIVDKQNHRVRVVNRTSNVINTFAGNGVATYSGDNGAAIQASLNLPESVTVDSENNLVYIADTGNNRVRVVNRTGNVINTMAGTGVPGFFGDGGLAINATLQGPQEVAIDSRNNLVFVTDTGNHRIRVVNRTSNMITTIAGNGASTFFGDGNTATTASFSQPISIAIDTINNQIYFTTENNRIRVVNLTSSIIRTVAGNGGSTFDGDAIVATSASIFYPLGVALHNGFLYISDSNNFRIRAVNLTSNIISTFAGNGFAGYSGDGKSATQATLNQPFGVAVDSRNKLLYIADRDNHRIRELNLTSNVIRTFAGNGFHWGIHTPTSIAIDQVHNLVFFATGDHKIKFLNRSSNLVTTFAGNGSPAFAGDGNAATSASLHAPRGIAIDTLNNLVYIADTLNNRIRVVNRTSSIITTLAGNGAETYFGDGNIATNASLRSPAGIALDELNFQLFIADAGNHRIRVVNLTTNIISTFAGNGMAGNSGNGGAPKNAQLNYPQAIAQDTDNNLLFICDQWSNRIRVINRTSNIITNFAGAVFRDPLDILFDANTLFVAGRYNHRIKAISRFCANCYVGPKCDTNACINGTVELVSNKLLSIALVVNIVVNVTVDVHVSFSESFNSMFECIIGANLMPAYVLKGATNKTTVNCQVHSSLLGIQYLSILFAKYNVSANAIEVDFFRPGQINSNSTLLGYANQVVNVTLHTNASVSIESLHKVKCYGNGTIFPTVVVQTNQSCLTCFQAICSTTFPYASVIRLGLRFDAMALSTNSIDMHFVTFINISNYVLRDTELSSQNYTASLVLAGAIVDVNNLKCMQSNMNMFVPLLRVSPLVFNCTVLTQFSSIATNVSVWYMFNGKALLIGSSNVSVTFIEVGAVAYIRPSHSISIVGNVLHSVMEYFSKPILTNKFRCVYSHGIPVHASVVSFSPFVLSCQTVQNWQSLGNVTIGFHFGNTVEIIANNSLPYAFLMKQNLYLPSFALHAAALVNVTILSTDSLLISNFIHYACEYSGSIVTTTLLNSTALICSLPAANQATYWISLLAISIVSNSSTVVSQQNISLNIWEQSLIQAILPSAIGYIYGQTEIFSLFIRVSKSLLTNQKLKCQVNFRIASVLVQESTNTAVDTVDAVRCDFVKPSTFGNSTVIVSISLQVTADNQNSLLQIATPNFIAFYEQPIRFAQSIVSGDVPSVLQLNVVAPDSNLNYTHNVILSPTYNVLRNPPFPLNCTFPSRQQTYCNLSSNFSFSHNPLMLNGAINVNRYSNVTAFTIIPVYYYKNVTLLSIFPFVNDINEYAFTQLTVSIIPSQLMNPTLKYECQVRNVNQSIATLVILSNDTVFCNLSLVDNIVSVQLVAIFNSTRVAFSNSIVTRFASLYMVPFVVQEAQAVHSSIHYAQSFESLVVPQVFAKNSFDVRANNGVSTQIIACNGAMLTCSKPAFGFGNQYAIQQWNLKLYMNHSFVCTIAVPLITYNNATLVSLKPNAALTTSTITIRITTDIHAFATAPGLNVSFCCLDWSSMICFNTSMVGTNFVQCLVDTSLISSTNNFAVRAMYVNSIVNTTHFEITLKNETASIALLQRGILHYNSTEHVFAVNTVQSFNLSLHTFIPSALLPFVKCKVASTTISTVYIGSSSQFFHSFSCQHAHAMPGLHILSLAYDDEIATFPLSTNVIELVFIQQAQIQSLSSYTALVNVTVQLYITSTFDSNQLYAADTKYYAHATRRASNLTRVFDAVLQGSLFTFSFNNSVEGVDDIALFISTKQRYLQLSSVASFLWLDGFFIEPNHNLVAGNETFVLNNYLGNSTVIQFTDFSVNISCSRNHSQLICNTPNLLGIKEPYFYYTLQLNGKSMGLPYIPYKMSKLTLSPRVFPSNAAVTVFDSTIFLNSTLSFGKDALTWLWITDSTNSTDRYNLGIAANNSVAISISLPKKASSFMPYIAELYLKLGYLLLPFNSLRISNAIPIFFVAPELLKLNSANIGYVNELFNVTVTLNAVYSDLISNTHCNLDSVLLPTSFIGNATFICTVFSSSVTVSNLSIVYVSNDAYNGRVILSLNTLPIVFLAATTLISIEPFVTLQSNEAAVLYSTMPLTNFPLFVTFYCKYGGKNNWFIASLQSDMILCSLTRQRNHSSELVEIWANSTLIGSKKMSTNSVLVAFTDLLHIAQLSPCSMSYMTLPMHRVVTLTFDKSILVWQHLQCIFVSHHDTQRVNASEISSNSASCLFTKNTQNALVEVAQVYLAVNNTKQVLNVSTRVDLLVASPIQFANEKPVTSSQIGHSMPLNFVVPVSMQNYTLQYLKQSGDWSNMSCFFVSTHPAWCEFPFLNVTLVPFTLELKLITYAFYGASLLNISSVTFVQETVLDYSYPALMNLQERKIIPGMIILKAKNVSFDTNFDLYCSVSGTLYKAKLVHTCNGCISCWIPFITEKTVAIHVVLNTTHLLVRPANLTFVEPLLASVSSGPITGGTLISVTYPIATPSTFSHYIKLVAVHREFACTNCVLNHDTLTCTTPLLSMLSRSNLKIEVWHEKLRAFSIGRFTAYSAPLVEAIYPSRFVYSNESVIELQGLFVDKPEVVLIKYNSHVEQYTRNCQAASVTKIRCRTPHGLGVGTTWNISLSFNLQPQFMQTFKSIQVTSFTIAQLISQSHSTLNVGTPDPFCMFGINFLSVSRTNISSISFDDLFGSAIASASQVNETTICLRLPTMYDANIAFPRLMKVSVTFNDGHMLHSHPLSILGLPLLEIHPNVIIVGSLVDHFSILNIPNIELQANHGPLSLQLVPLNVTIWCNQTLCKMNTLLLSVGSYDVSITASPVVLQTKLLTPLKVVPQPFISRIEPAVIVLETTKYIFVHGYAFSVGLKPVIRFVYVTSKRVGTMLSVLGEIITSTLIRFSFANQVPGMLISPAISFDNGASYSLLNNATIAVLPPASYIVQNSDDNNFASVFTFRSTKLSLLSDDGKLPTVFASSFVIRLHLPIIGTITMNATQIRLTSSSNAIHFDLPAFVELIPYVAALFETKLGISVNGGHDFVTMRIFVLNRYRQPTVTSIDTRIIPYLDHTITLRGSSLGGIVFCIVQSSNQTYFLVPRVISVSVIDCYVNTSSIPPSILNANDTTLNVLNTQGESSSVGPIPVLIYEAPIPLSFQPKQVPSAGNVHLLLRLSNLPTTNELFVRTGAIIQPFRCQRATNEYVSCFIGALEPGAVSISITFNKVHFYTFTHSLQYLACSIGWTTRKFDLPCEPCKAGTYKPTIGSYECLSCLKNTYSSSIASSKCDTCPVLTVSAFGSSQQNNCTCTIGTMINPNIESSDKCIPCPIGANCTKLNTIIPEALPGYWFSNHSASLFFTKCNPLSACPGGFPYSCATGYTSNACGKCDNGYYKSNAKCLACSGSAEWRLVLTLAVVLVLVVTFFVFSSSKVGHIGAIGIASSFFQVIFMFTKIENIKWPAAIDTSFTFAAALAFEFDFLSPECLFLGMKYNIKYIIAQLAPAAVGLVFVLFFLVGQVRNIWSIKIGSRLFSKLGYIKFFESPVGSMRAKNAFVGRLFSLIRVIGNAAIWIVNFVIWYFKEPVSQSAMIIFRDNIFNAFLTFLYFTYSFLMINSTSIFNCTLQTNGYWTLNASADVLCYASIEWFSMLPFSILIFVGMNLATIGFYIYLLMNMHQLVNTNIRRKFKFVLHKFKRSYFFWHGLVLFRKVFISILLAFLQPQLVITLSLFIIAVSVLLHIQFVPYRKKFHNLMEYFVLLATLCTLFCGLLFFINRFPTPEFAYFMQVVAILIMICSAIVCVGMVVWDYLTRKKKDAKTSAKTKHRIFNLVIHLKQQKKPYEHLLMAAQGTKTKYLENGQVTFVPPLFNDVRDSDDEEFSSLNAILENLFSWKRLKRKLFVVQRNISRRASKIRQSVRFKGK